MASPGTGAGPADMGPRLGTQGSMRCHSSLPWQHVLGEEERESKKGEGEL